MTQLQLLKVELEKLRLDAISQKHGRVYAKDVLDLIEHVKKMLEKYEAGAIYEYLNGERKS